MSIPSRHAPLPEGEEKARAVRAMFDAIAPRYDLVNRVMTFRMDVGWRRRTVDELALPSGSIVLDLASGTGDLSRELRDRGLEAISVDLSEGMLRADRSGVPRVLADVLQLPLRDGDADGATCGFALRNLRDLPSFFGELARVVRVGGRVALLEVATPDNAVMRWGHGIYFGHVVPVIGGWLSDGDAYRYLPRSVAYLPEPDALVDMFRAAGFPDAQRTTLSGGVAQLLTGTRR
jgi:demethylmenaquinone methyltransferase / 2-methoxy-6-polyprenyl-1,4-benzoquinol methylase